ncbi:MAG: succinate dehydrogenase, hydrophobic membrane anchor protein [Thermodesulfovibrio sp.]|nr:succinate dehydrogenase, hydrophobic membrane anchor protein [Thermodesulfovibrio sp.]
MWSWLLHRVTGVLLFFGLLYHFYTMHIIPDNYSYETVIKRLSEPSWQIFNIVFLFSSLYHGFYGLHGLVVEYIKDSSLKRVLSTLVYFIPLILAFFGVKIVFF